MVKLKDVERFLNWVNRKLKIHSHVENAKKRVVKRGQIYWCDFGENIGSEQCSIRPAVILQNDIGNLTSSNTIVAPITNAIKNVRVNVDLQRPESSPVKGCVLLGNIRVVSKARLGDYIDSLSKDEMNKVEEALFVSLGVIGKVRKLMERVEKLHIQLDRVKDQRNKAEDELKLIKEELKLDPSADIQDIIQRLKKGA